VYYSSPYMPTRVYWDPSNPSYYASLPPPGYTTLSVLLPLMYAHLLRSPSEEVLGSEKEVYPGGGGFFLSGLLFLLQLEGEMLRRVLALPWENC